MEDERIAIHESATSEKVLRFIPLSQFNTDFQKARDNGDIWGCYENEDGDIEATTKNDGAVMKNILV